MDKCLKIKFFSRSFDLRLYDRSKGLYQQAEIECVRLTDQSADGYFYTMLSDKDCDIAINIDEDCFITDLNAVMELTEYVIDNGYANCGCPDGGSFSSRKANPLVTNPFFNIINLKLIRENIAKNGNGNNIIKAIKQQVKLFDYNANKEKMIESFPKEILQNKYDFNNQTQEPYYKFFLWLACNFKVLYLKSSLHEDGTTTILFNHSDKQICMHTWYARFYSVPSVIVRYFQHDAGKQQNRINAIIDSAYQQRNLVFIPEYTSSRYLSDRLIRYFVKFFQRTARLPKKLFKKLTN
ncbi:MAG: hypothetical protein IJ834_06560 [Paludibacteraceae bacterium]|nr:hypothetical protein [Paludibacteraceae bacterium]